jgi:ABC-type siderophore export system fused ATPase/permease subunit
MSPARQAPSNGHQHLILSEGVTAIVATHDPMLIDLADRVIELRDGQVVDDDGPVGRSAGASSSS